MITTWTGLQLLTYYLRFCKATSHVRLPAHAVPVRHGQTRVRVTASQGLYATHFGGMFASWTIAICSLEFYNTVYIVLYRIHIVRGVLQKEQEAQLPLRNRASAMHFFVAKLLYIAVMTYSYVYHLRNLCPVNLLRTQRINFSMRLQHVRMTRYPTVVWCLLSKEPLRISAYILYCRKLESMAYISAADSIHSCGGLRKTPLFCNRMRIGRSRSSKVVDFGNNRKGVCNFLLVALLVTLVSSCTVSEIRVS